MLFQGPIPSLVEQNDLTAAGHFSPDRPQTILRLASGQTLVLPTDLLIAATGDAVSISPPSSQSAYPNSSASAPQNGAPGESIISLTEEHADVSKREVETAKIRIQRSTETFNQTATLPLTNTTWQVERIPVGQLVPNRPEVRQQGETTVYPLVEERFVAKREYFLIEEVHVTRTAITTEQTATLELQRDVLSVDREDLSPDLS